jgi:hypothetical protein
MPRFVLLYHDCPPGFERPSHWDLMFEKGAVLRTWALAGLPRGWLSDSAASEALDKFVDAEQLADHRLMYLDYEGPVSGERGQVRRLDAGTFAALDESPVHWELELWGNRLRGRIRLERHAVDTKQWTLACIDG